MGKKINWAKWLVLPLMMSACVGGGNEQQNHASDDHHSAHLTSSKKVKNQPTKEKQAHTDQDLASKSDSDHDDNHADYTHVDSYFDHTHSDDHSDHTHTTKNKTVTTIPKAEITPELIAQVKAAKEIRDNTGLPPGYQATYTINAGEETKEVNILVPEDNDIDENPYYPNASDIYPLGMSSGTIKSSLLKENEQGELKRKPHTEDRFMSYQQFYSGVDGTYRDVVYFGDQRVETHEKFFFHLPDGLLTTNDQLPTAGQAVYDGKAIDGERFGDFHYQVDFAKKEGQGKISWQETKAGQLGDITLQTGKVAEQLLSTYPEPEGFPPQFSQKGPGVLGVAKIKGDTEKEYQYQAVFFGPKAEELSGLVYEVVHKEHHLNHAHNHGDEVIHDHGSDSSHNVEKINVTAFSGQR